MRRADRCCADRASGGHPVVLAGLVIVALACHGVCVVAAGKAAATVLSEAGELR